MNYSFRDGGTETFLLTSLDLFSIIRAATCLRLLELIQYVQAWFEPFFDVLLSTSFLDFSDFTSIEGLREISGVKREITSLEPVQEIFLASARSQNDSVHWLSLHR